MRMTSADKKYAFRRLAGLLSAAFLLTVPYSSSVQAEEQDVYFDGAGKQITLGDSSSEIIVIDNPELEVLVQESSESLMGIYSVEEGWVLDEQESTTEQEIYKQETLLEQTETSVITCSYLDTSYSVMEYEQLRDMLTNKLLYSNVNAQISTSAAYTTDKDYLYILTVDDSSQSYRSIYHYVVGDYRCFLVEVKEYRAEAEQARSEGQKTPQEIGQSVAEGFVWNTQW